MDDILLLAESREMIHNHLAGVTYLLENVGFIISRKKSVMNPAQTLEFLSLTVDSMEIELHFPPHE